MGCRERVVFRKLKSRKALDTLRDFVGFLGGGDGI